jgi:hypothetical protein
MNLFTTSETRKQEDTLMTSYIRTKIRLRQVSDIYCEMIKLRDGEIEHTCSIRNMLQIFSGEMLLHCSLDISEEITLIARMLDQGISDTNWEETNNHILKVYEVVLKKCSIIYR